MWVCGFLKSLYLSNIPHSFECFPFIAPRQFSALSSLLSDIMSNGCPLRRDAEPFCLTAFEIRSCYLQTSSSKELDITWPSEEKKNGLARKNWKNSHAQEKHYALVYVTLKLFILILKGKLQEGGKFTQYRIRGGSDCMMKTTPAEYFKTCMYFPCKTVHLCCSFIPTIIYITWSSWYSLNEN